MLQNNAPSLPPPPHTHTQITVYKKNSFLQNTGKVKRKKYRVRKMIALVMLELIPCKVGNGSLRILVNLKVIKNNNEKNSSRTCCKHSRPSPYCVIVVCRRNVNCVDPEQSRLIWFCIFCPDDQFENLGSLR